MEGRKYYIESYGCQMNLYDAEIVGGILDGYDFTRAGSIEDADVIMVNTCAVREHAESRVLGHLGNLKRHKAARPDVKIGVLGCMAQRIGSRILDENPFVDFVLGPDAYRRLPDILDDSEPPVDLDRGLLAIERKETYDDVYPSRKDGVSAWVAVMRGCDNFCTFCIVPFVRGRERSRPVVSVVSEVERLAGNGFVEVTLLGQNVNSYRHDGADFADLLRAVARVDGIKRVRFTTSLPDDFSDKLIDAIADEEGICKCIHLPVQSGSDRILRLMRRNYTRSEYLALVDKARERIPGIAFSTDIIVGFPSETPEEFEETRSLMEHVQFESAFMFKYSPREGTKAHKLPDDVNEAEKVSRLISLKELQDRITLRKNLQLIGKRVKVLVEGASKKSSQQLKGRTGDNRIVVFDRNGSDVGDMETLAINGAAGHTLFGAPVHG